jgi:hypothetical protein
MAFQHTGNRDWGRDIISAERCTVICECIERGGTPDDIRNYLRDTPKVIADAVEHQLLQMAMFYENIAFVAYFARVVPPQLLTTVPHQHNLLLDLAVRQRASPKVLDCLSQIEPIADPARMFITCATLHNLQALDWLIERMKSPPIDRVVLRTMLGQSFSLPEYKWLMAHGLTASDFDAASLFMTAVHFQQRDIVEWIKDALAYEPDCSDNNTVVSLLRRNGLPWLLTRFTVPELFAVNAVLCATAVLKNGNPELLSQLPAEWASHFNNDSAYVAAVFNGDYIDTVVDIAVLDFIAESFPEINFPAELYRQLPSRTPVRALDWFHRRAPFDRAVIDALVHRAALWSKTEWLDYFTTLIPDPLYWRGIAQTMAQATPGPTSLGFTQIETVVWFETYCARRGVVCFEKLPDPATLLWNITTEIGYANSLAGARVRQVFDRLSTPEFMQMIALPDVRRWPAHRANVLRLWWQHQRAKMGLLIMASRRQRAAPRLPAELWHWIAAEFLAGTAV